MAFLVFERGKVRKSVECNQLFVLSRISDFFPLEATEKKIFFHELESMSSWTTSNPPQNPNLKPAIMRTVCEFRIYWAVMMILYSLAGKAKAASLEERLIRHTRFRLCCRIFRSCRCRRSSFCEFFWISQSGRWRNRLRFLALGVVFFVFGMRNRNKLVFYRMEKIFLKIDYPGFKFLYYEWRHVVRWGATGMPGHHRPRSSLSLFNQLFIEMALFCTLNDLYTCFTICYELFDNLELRLSIKKMTNFHTLA